MPRRKEKEPGLMRTAKIPLRLTRKQRSQVWQLMAAQRWCYNEIIAALKLETSPVYPIANGDAVRHCYVKGKGADRARKEYAEHGTAAIGVPVVEYRGVFKFSPWNQIKARCDWMPAPFESSSKYGISGKQVSATCKKLGSHIDTFFSQRKRGNFKAQLPAKFRSARDASGRLWEVPADECRWKQGRLSLGASTQVGGFLVVDVPRKFRGVDVRKASITIDEAGQPWLHLSCERPEPIARELPHAAAIDPGQIRAMVVADDSGRIRSLSGRSVLAVKRERERRSKAIARLRARVFRGHVRQYLAPEERDTMAEMERKSCGAGTKYARRMVSQRRREEQIARHSDAGKPMESFRFQRYSKRDWALLQAFKRVNTIARRKLNYANHCITRRVANWCNDRGVGVVFLGDVHSIPKGRKKDAVRRLQAKRNALWEIGNQQKLLAEKLEEYGATLSLQSERFTSQTCPVCGARRKPRGRLYVCRSCGWKGDRDGVGAANILSDALALETRIVPGRLKPLSLSAVMKSKDARVLARDIPSRLVGQCDPLECGDSLPRAVMRESVGIPVERVGKSPRNPHSVGKTAESATEKVRAKRESLATTSIAAVERSDDPIPTTRTMHQNCRSAQNNTGTYTQLDIWG